MILQLQVNTISNTWLCCIITVLEEYEKQLLDHLGVNHTLWLIDQHQTAQQRGEGQGEEGNVRVPVSSQKLQQERQDWCEARRRGMTSELQEVLTVKSQGTFTSYLQFHVGTAL